MPEPPTLREIRDSIDYAAEMDRETLPMMKQIAANAEAIAAQLDNPDHAKRIARAMIDRETRRVVKFAPFGELKDIPLAETVGMLVYCDNSYFVITAWDETLSDEGLKQILTAYELSGAWPTA